jgi:hypothetical protein
MINLNKGTVSWDAQVLAFKWYQNIGDALSHFAHFSSFLSEIQREDALSMISTYNERCPDWKKEDFRILKFNVEIAPIKSDRPTITKTQLSSCQTPTNNYNTVLQ